MDEITRSLTIQRDHYAELAHEKDLEIARLNVALREIAVGAIKEDRGNALITSARLCGIARIYLKLPDSATVNEEKS